MQSHMEDLAAQKGLWGCEVKNLNLLAMSRKPSLQSKNVDIRTAWEQLIYLKPKEIQAILGRICIYSEHEYAV
jgi:hypothetical protein